MLQSSPGVCAGAVIVCWAAVVSIRIDPLPSAVSELTLSGFGGARRSTPMWDVLEVGLGVRADHPG